MQAFLKLRKIALVLLISTPVVLTAQSTLFLQFQPVLGVEKIVLDQPIRLSDNDSVRLSALRFYLSNFVFLKNGVAVYSEGNSYHLLDLEDASSMLLAFRDLPMMAFDSLKFDLGIDSVTTVSGVMGGDLDPTHGMFWAWQSGYINFKVEGFSKKSAAHRGEFQLHLGGYLPPFASLQTVYVPVIPTENAIIYFDLLPMLEKINWVQRPRIMSPCSTAVDLSRILAKSFNSYGG